MAANVNNAVSVIDAPGADAECVPVLPAPATEHRATAARDLLPALRRFHRGDPGAASALSSPRDDLVPALLHRSRDPERVRCEYPVLLSPPGSDDGSPACTTITDFATDADPDGLERLERSIREVVDRRGGPVDARSAIQEATEALAEDLAPDPVPASLLATQQALAGAVPDDAALLALSEHTPLHLFIAAARRGARTRYDVLRDEVTRLGRVMRDLLRAERVKHAAESRSDVLEETVGRAAAAHIDVEALAGVLGKPRGVESADDGRRGRIEAVTEVFERFLAGEAPPVLRVVASSPGPETLPKDVAWHAAGAPSPCRRAMDLFDDQATTYAELFAAVRIARLLDTGAYDPERHDALQEAFAPEAFSADELRALPPIVVLESGEDLSGDGLLDLSRLLCSGRPLHVIVTVQPAIDPGRPRDEDPLAGYRFELAYLGISHREALVHQSSAARPTHLMQGFLDGLDATLASLHVLTSGLTAEGVAPKLGAWAHTGAALEGRAHPFINYDPEAGTTWARRFDIDGNPQPDEDWPVYELACRSADGSPETLPMAFTFADFALLEHRYCDHFRVIPPDIDHADVVQLGAYLAMLAAETADADEIEHKLPFIWAADPEGQLHRLLVTRRLAFACRDRLDYWRTLQELAGVRNEHVREAVEREREQLESAHADEQERLAAEHAAKLDAAREDAARDAMQRLARALVSTDPASALAALTSAPAPVAAPVPVAALAPVAAPAPEPEPEPAPADEPEDPWIDSILCTSCNDCIDINKQLFTYNSNKQAVIGDPAGGTFEQLVKAAEKCPAKCIHPGAPLDPSEPNLPDLIERAKPFNP